MSDCELILGDALDVLRRLPAASVDAVVTDPPYGIVNRFGMQRRRDGTRRLQFAWDGPETGGLVAEVLRLALAACKPSAALFVFTSIDIVGRLLPVAREAGFTVKPAAWVKKCPPPAAPGNWWPSAFELAFYGYRNRPWFGDAGTRRRNVFVADSYRHGQPGKVAHPTQKPLALMTHLVASVVPPGGTVLDPFAGSGTTLVAARASGRRAVGIEIDPGYHGIALGRLAAARAPAATAA